MIEKIALSTEPDEELLLSFVVGTSSVKADILLVEFANYEMREKLKKQRDKGFRGWHTAECENNDLKERLLKNVSSGDWVDVLNLAAMLLARERMFTEKHIA